MLESIEGYVEGYERSYYGLWYGSAGSGADRPVPIADVLRPELHGVAKYYLEDRGRDEHWGEL